MTHIEWLCRLLFCRRRRLGYGVLFGIAPVLLPVVPVTHGLFTPVLSTGPVAIEALLAPDPLFPAPLDVAAIDVWVAVPLAGVCADKTLVRLQAEFESGFEVWAKAGLTSAKANTKGAIDNVRYISFS